MTRRWFLPAGCLLVAMALALAAEGDRAAASTELVELTGIVTQAAGTTNLQLRVDSGPVYKVLPSRDARALFADTNLHHRPLLMKARLHAGPAVELVGNLHAIRNGKLYELYYYCDICAIISSFPELCQCCREPVVLVEEEKGKLDQ